MAAAPSRRVLVLRCPDWLAAGDEQEPGAAARAFEPVVAIVEEFCPQVEVLRPGLAAIAARGPARYFGGEAALAARLAEAACMRGFACQVGVADGLFAADLAAQSGPAGLLVPPGETPQFLAGLPVTALPFDALGVPELAELLPRLGIHTLGEFAALPAAEAGSRFGAQGIIVHRLARGLDPRPLAPQPPRLDLSVEQAFDPPAEQSELVVFTAKALADQMHVRLAARGLACVRVRVQVHCADGQELSRLWRHDGLLSALAVAERVRWQLDGWRAGTGPGGGDRPGVAAGWARDEGARDEGARDEGARDEGARDEGAGVGGITLLRLVPDQLVRATGRQLGLWGDAVVSDKVARAAIRVQAILGHGAVTRPVLSGGRSPAEQVLLTPFGDTGVPRRPADQPWPGQIPAPAPATVYPEPLPVSVTDGAGQVVSVSGRAQLSAPPAWLSSGRGPARAVTCWAGPWPVTERWWDPARTRRQARFQLVTEDGSAWLAVLQDGQWLIEARYD
jgi:protein ImuB